MGQALALCAEGAVLVVLAVRVPDALDTFVLDTAQPKSATGAVVVCDAAALDLLVFVIEELAVYSISEGQGKESDEDDVPGDGGHDDVEG